MNADNPIQHLVRCLTHLPGVGEKTATRLALFLVNCPKEDALELARSIVLTREKICFCSRCFNYSESELCQVCANPVRDATSVCVVETPADILSVERTGGFAGTYHVLHGAIAPIDGIGPDQLRIKELVQRVQQDAISEIILATNPTMNGNATAVYIADQLRAYDVLVTRIAQGVTPGGDIGYADQMALKNALEGRHKMK